jgi:integrase
MARRVRDTDLENRTVRRKLKAQGKPHFRRLDQGLHIGFRRLSGERSGKWVVRFYVGKQAYAVETVATADDFSDANGVNVLTYDQATVKARELRDRRARAGAGEDGPLTVADAIKSYLDFLETNKKTARDAKYRADALILPKLGHVEVNALTTAMIRQWHVGVAKAPARTRTKAGDAQRHRENGQDDETIRRRRSTANRTLGVLRAALNQAWRDGRVETDAEWRRVKPFKGVDAARTRHLTVAEASRLINAADPDFRNVVRAALETGARYGELTRLLVSDFDPDAGTLFIRVSKSDSSRHVVLTPEGARFFSGLTAGRTASEVMLRKRSGAAWGKSDQKRPMAAACVRARIVPAVGIHTLRHSYASLSIMAGMPMKVAAENLGHSSTKMLEKHYGHLSRSYVVDQVRRSAPRFDVEAATNVTPLK